MTPTGTQTLLVSPNMATINGIDVNPNPEVRAPGTPGTARYDWMLAPNPGGLPLLGSAFSLTVRSNVPASGLAAAVFGFHQLGTPMPLLGIELHVDLTSAVTSILWFQDEATLSLALPNDNGLRGVRLFAQTLHDQGTATLAASPLVELTVL